MYNSDPFDFNGNGSFDPVERVFRDEFLTGGFVNDEYSADNAWDAEGVDSWDDND